MEAKAFFCNCLLIFLVGWTVSRANDVSSVTKKNSPPRLRGAHLVFFKIYEKLLFRNKRSTG